MELRERIKQLRKEKKMTRLQLHQRLVNIFGDKALQPNTIWRIESGAAVARASSLHQICVGLGVSLKEILGEAEPQSRLVDIVRKEGRTERYIHNEYAQSEILTPPSRGFLAEELDLAPNGQTRTEENPVEAGKFEKWIYCLNGEITCVVGTEKHKLNKNDCLSFQSNIPHHFENNSNKKSSCIIVLNPRYI